MRQHGHGSPFTFYTHTGWQMTSEDMPKCMDISFWPPPGMQFFGHELVIPAYVFDEGLDQSEILVQNDHCVGNKEALWTLRPGEDIVDDVINLVVAMLTAGKDQHRWWLPTTFFIYIPLHIGHRWYLMILDMWEEKLEVIDSTQMALAIDLVMDSHNPITKKVTERDMRYWNRSNRTSYKKKKRQVKKAISPMGPLSPSL
ncbi:hypothetical protein Ahy_B04g071669 isoform A [Arachis hypogaea]|uniref:Ubiquitin-like protease family profile domain-containing protein n=1 Tax=Arachis hypogaea TaxID=3818 RepID=A0A444ZL95_ARAHY|nr:hypothetical protein Ahy_B04g071669 isoform A [Arachis hypogaea]